MKGNSYTHTHYPRRQTATDSYRHARDTPHALRTPEGMRKETVSHGLTHAKRSTYNKTRTPAAPRACPPADRCRQWRGALQSVTLPAPCVGRVGRSSEPECIRISVRIDIVVRTQVRPNGDGIKVRRCGIMDKRLQTPVLHRLLVVYVDHDLRRRRGAYGALGSAVVCP